MHMLTVIWWQTMKIFNHRQILKKTSYLNNMMTYPDLGMFILFQHFWLICLTNKEPKMCRMMHLFIRNRYIESDINLMKWICPLKVCSMRLLKQDNLILVLQSSDIFLFITWKSFDNHLTVALKWSYKCLKIFLQSYI